jgi:glycosyltransferase involved in cell wall biosynthesis
MDITVAIRTYNGATRLPDVLDNLRGQLGTEGIAWEILVVDNNSNDRTEEVIAHYRKAMPHVRSCRETKQGQALARNRAFREASGELIAFLDDDNVPDAHWVGAVAQFAQSHPQAGAYGSQIHADYAASPPPNFARIARFLAINDLGSQPFLFKKYGGLLPPGAGLVVRKSVWQQYVPAEMILTGRIDDHMLGGEDLEMLRHIQASPWEIWYNPAMKITHRIPAARLEKKYLIRLLRGNGCASYVIRTVSAKRFKKYILTVAYLCSDLKKILLHVLKYRSEVKTDLVAACELEFLIGRLISPFFLWRNGYLSNKKPL